MHQDIVPDVRSTVVSDSELEATLAAIVRTAGAVLAVVPVPTGYRIVSRHDKRAPAQIHFNIHDLVAELKKLPATRPDRPSMAFRMQADGKIEPWIQAYAPTRLAAVLDPGQSSHHLLDREEMAYLLVRAYQAGRVEASEAQ